MSPSPSPLRSRYLSWRGGIIRQLYNLIFPKLRMWIETNQLILFEFASVSSGCAWLHLSLRSFFFFFIFFSFPPSPKGNTSQVHDNKRKLREGESAESHLLNVASGFWNDWREKKRFISIRRNCCFRPPTSYPSPSPPCQTCNSLYLSSIKRFASIRYPHLSPNQELNCNP